MGIFGTEVWYTTRETVKAALDVRETARANAQIDRAILGSSRDIEDNLLNRVFYPTLATRKFDWPPIINRSWPWTLWLDDNEIISVTSIVSGGVTLSPSSYFLEPVKSGPPFDRIDINLASQQGFSIGSTFQQSIVITGLFGFDDRRAVAGSLAEALDTSETEVDVTDSASIGIGHLINVDNERMRVTGKKMLTTGDTVTSTANNADVSIVVPDGTKYTVDETLLADSERMRVVDIAGNTLTVKRAQDGSVLAAHTSATLYAPRTLVVERAVLGTTAATHTLGTAIQRQVIPGPVENLCVAESLNTLLQEQAGYARTVGSGDNVRNASGAGLADMRARVFASHGRKVRYRAV